MSSIQSPAGDNGSSSSSSSSSHAHLSRDNDLPIPSNPNMRSSDCASHLAAVLANQAEVEILLKYAFPRRRFNVPKKIFEHILAEGSWMHRISTSEFALQTAQRLASTDLRIAQTLGNMTLSRRNQLRAKTPAFRQQNVAAILCINYYAALSGSSFRQAYCKAFFSSASVKAGRNSTRGFRILQDTLKRLDTYSADVKAEKQAFRRIQQELEYVQNAARNIARLESDLST